MKLEEDMQNDNQVRREKELDELLSLNGWFGKEAVKAVSPVLKAFISRVAKDSYAEGISRAREVAAEIWLINDVDEALKKLEEEVKK